MNEDQLRELLLAGESETVEFKRGVPAAKDLDEAVVCFANAGGGRVFLGVDDRGKILGCRDYDMDEIKRNVFTSTDPPLVVEVTEVETTKGTVLVVAVPESPVLHSTTSGKYLRRVGRTCQPLSPSLLPNVLVRKGQLDFTAMPVLAAALEDLDYFEVQRLRAILGERAPRSELTTMSDGDLLSSLELVRKEGDDLRPTVAGLLLAGKPAALNSFVPGARVTYLHFSEDKTEYDFREDLQRPLLALLERMGELIEARNRLDSVPMGLIRLEVRDFPPEAYREGILNALCHRDYTQHDAVYIRHYTDKLEIESPGGFPSGITPKTILHHRPKHRNPVLARALQRLGYVEQAGIGVDRMYRVLLANGKEPPEYLDYEDAVRLVLRDGVSDQNIARFAAESAGRGHSLSLDELIVLSHLKRQQTVDRAIAATVCQRSEREAGEVLAGMLRVGLVERRGTGGGTVYVLPARLAYLAGEEAAYSRDRAIDGLKRRELVREYVANWGAITNEKCRELCGLNFHQASRLLAALCREGVLIRRGAGRYTRYVAGERPSPPG